MSVAEVGARVKELEDRCPICGACPRTEHCMDPVDLTLCPNADACNNKDGENRRIGCDGYLRGNVGFGIMLGNNILVQMRKDINFETREDILSGTTGAWKKRIKDYKKKVVDSYMVYFEGLVELTEYYHGEIPQKETEELLKKEAEEFQDKVEKEIEDLRAQKTNLHPLAKGGGIQAHHLICSEAMATAEWKELAKLTGYNVNCRLNGVYLPSGLPLACTAKVPLHKGGHSAGFGGEILGGEYLNYPKRVKDEIGKIINDIRKEKPCTNPQESIDIAKNIVEDLNKASEKIFNNVDKFVWTITWDGFDYMTGNPIGCGNQRYITDKQGTRRKKKKPVKYKDFKNVQQKFLDQQALRIEEIEKKRIQTVDEFHEMLENEEYKEIRCDCGRDHEKIQNKLKISGKYTLKLGE